MKRSRRTQPCQAYLNIERPKQASQISLWRAEMAPWAAPVVIRQGRIGSPHRRLDSLGFGCGEDADGLGASLGPARVSVVRVTCDSWMKRNWPTSLELTSFQSSWRTSVGSPGAPTSSVHLDRISSTRGWCKPGVGRLLHGWLPPLASTRPPS